MKVFKYTLDKRILGKPQVVRIPRHGQLLKSAFFNGDICMWYCLDENQSLQPVQFIVNYTGDELNNYADYIDTVIDHENKLVYHISVL